MHTFQPVEPATRSMNPSPVAARPRASRSTSSRFSDRWSCPRTPSWLARARTRLAQLTALLLLAAATLHAGTALAQALLAVPSLPLSGIARVETIAVQSDGKIIIGGAFNYVNAAGDVRVNIARFNSNGTLDTSFHFRATSAVNALAIIGNTLYVGGDFTGLSKVGGASTLRNRLGAIDLPSLTVTSFDPNVDGEVLAMVVSGTTLYVGGRFTFVGGTQRIGGAAFNTSAAGALTAWDPEARDSNAPGPAFQGVVHALAVSGSVMYVGGTFTQIGGLVNPGLRDNLAAVNLTTGEETAWDPVVGNGGGTAIVRAIVPTASVVYFGGQFTEVGGIGTPFVQRVGIAAVSASTGAATAWNPGSTSGGGGTVRALVLDGATLYAGGEFTAIGGAARIGAAGIDTATPAITTLTRAGSTATATVASTAGLANGNFVTIAGATDQAYNGIKPITVIDATHFSFPVSGSPVSPATGTIAYARNNNATAFNPNLDGDVSSMALAASLLMGGDFLKVNNVANPAFAGFNKTTGARTIAGYVYDTAAVWSLMRQADGKTIVAGDFFMNTGGVFYRNLIRLNANDTLDTSWNPVTDGQIVTATLGPIVPPATAPNTVLIGGTFTTVAGTARPRLAAVSLSTGLATAFNANVDGPVNRVIVDGTTAYIGGRFREVGGVERNFIAAVTATSGALQAWYPAGGADDFVEALAVDASSVYAGGSFLTMGGQSRPNIAKIAKSNSAVAAWNPGANEIVFTITVSGSTVYVGGNFSALGGIARNFAGAINASTGAITAWNPNPDFVVLKIVPAPSDATTVYLAGAFIHVNAVQTGNAAAVNTTTGALRPWYPLMNDAVYDLLPDATRVILGGVFVNTALVTPRLSLAAFTRAAVPDPPTAVVATAANGSASVTFSAPANNGGNPITGYTVTSSPAGGVDSNAGSTGTTHTITGLANGTAYTFRVTATNAVGTSAPSAASNSVTPTAPTLPGAPTNVVANAGNAQASVTFTTPASNGGAPITGYTVTSNPAGGVDSQAGSTSTTHTITNLVNGTAYTFTVRATNSVGVGPVSVASNSVTPTPPAGTPTVVLSPSSVSFGAVNVGITSAAKTVVLSNTGTGTLTIASIAVTGNYARTHNCGSTLPASGSCNINVTFTPAASGVRNGALNVTSNAGGSPHSVPLTGSGVAAGDTTPNAFVFLPAYNLSPGFLAASNAITVAGINAPAPISVSNGSYRINNGSATSAPGSVNAGDTVTAVGTAPAAKKQTKTVTVTIGGVAGSFVLGTEASTRSDLNGDGRSDLVWRNTTTGDVNAWMLNGLALIAGTGNISNVPGSAWVTLATGDFDGDGEADILWRNNVTAAVNVWLMNDRALKPGSGTILGLNPSQWLFAGVGDVNNDGRSDILWRNATSGDLYVWMMNGKAIVSSGLIGNASLAWAVVGVGDFDGDGKADLLWHNTTTGAVSAWLLDGRAIRSSGQLSTLAVSQWQFAGIGDTNGDGKQDVVWRNTVTGGVYLWMMNGIRWLPGSGLIGTTSASAWSIIGMGDFNRDGKYDLLWRSTSHSVNVWFLDGPVLKAGSGAITTLNSQWQLVRP